LTPAEKRELVDYARSEHHMSLRQACILFVLSTSVYYYRTKRCDQDDHIVHELRSLAHVHLRWGFWMMFHRLRQNMHTWNHKRVYRVYTEMRLNLRRKYKQRLPSRIKLPLIQPLYPNMNWSMDFMSDALLVGRPFRSFNVIDDYNREALNITLDTSITSTRVIRELDELVEWRGKPEQIRVDNGPEFIAQALKDWCDDKQIDLVFIQKGKPNQNGFVERFNRTYREEVLDAYAFESLAQARQITQAWMWVYNNERPHSALGYLPPTVFLQKHGRLINFPTLQKDNTINYKNLITNVAS
jgi:putative transposase